MSPPTHRHVKLTSTERQLRSLLAAATRSGDEIAVRRLRLEYNLAVARRRADEYASRADELAAELDKLPA